LLQQCSISAPDGALINESSNWPTDLQTTVCYLRGRMHPSRSDAEVSARLRRLVVSKVGDLARELTHDCSEDERQFHLSHLQRVQLAGTISLAAACASLADWGNGMHRGVSFIGEVCCRVLGARPRVGHVRQDLALGSVWYGYGPSPPRVGTAQALPKMFMSRWRLYLRIRVGEPLLFGSSVIFSDPCSLIIDSGERHG
jgi:hypothetical protein